jgi:hypothetical protein
MISHNEGLSWLDRKKKIETRVQVSIPHRYEALIIGNFILATPRGQSTCTKQIIPVVIKKVR